MRLIIAATALAGFCALLLQTNAQAQSSARCSNLYNQVNAAVAQRDRAALVRLLGLPAAQQCEPEAQTARAALSRLTSPLPLPPVLPPVAPPVRVSPPPLPVVRADPAAEEAAAWSIAQDADGIGGYNAYLRRYPNGPNASRARQRIAALTPPVSPPTSPPRIASLDARNTPANTRAPLVADPSSLPDFALFRECEGCPEMVVIPAGSFLMGSPASESGRDEDEDNKAGAGGAPVGVRVPRFAIARFETTWDEWAACVSAGVCQQREDAGYGRGRRPVINVDWQTDTRAFIRFVNGRASGYRLPSEAEWEYAARAGTPAAYPWGSSASHEHANYGADQCCSGLASGPDQWVNTAPVGQFPANSFGLYDLQGNVWEWVEDCYRGNLSGQTAAAWTTGDCSSRRVLRGGSWGNDPQFLRSADRSRISPTVRDDDWGFRLARTL